MYGSADEKLSRLIFVFKGPWGIPGLDVTFGKFGTAPTSSYIRRMQCESYIMVANKEELPLSA